MGTAHAFVQAPWHARRHWSSLSRHQPAGPFARPKNGVTEANGRTKTDALKFEIPTCASRHNSLFYFWMLDFGSNIHKHHRSRPQVPQGGAAWWKT